MSRTPTAKTLMFVALLLTGGCAAPRQTLHWVVPAEARARRAPAAARAAAAETPPAATAVEPLRVHFVDVGQGDCTLIACPNGKRVLVDAGSSTGNVNVGAVRSYLLAQLDAVEPHVDALVITHSDSDHYDLLPTVLAGVQVDHIYYSGSIGDHDEANVDDWLRGFDAARRTRMFANSYNVAPPKSLGDFGDVSILVLASNVPDTTVDSETNTRSIVLKVTFGDVDFMLTGDATRDTENDIMARIDAPNLDVEVLKMGHHGSNFTSTSPEWAAAVQPEVAVVSAGWNNTYGHPHRDVVQRLEPFTVAADPHAFRWRWRESNVSRFADFPAFEEAIYSTAASGNIVITTSGTDLTVSHDR